MDFRRISGIGTWARRHWLILTLVALALGIRAVLPLAIESYVNRTLARLDGYVGQVDDVDLHLWRGAYAIEGLEINKTGGEVPVPFVSAERIDLSVEWGALLNGSIVSEIELFSPSLNLVAPPSKSEPEKGQMEASSNWFSVVKDLTPFQINRLAIQGGKLHYRDFNSTPKVNVYLSRLQAEAHNLTNSKELSDSMEARFHADALAMGSGSLRMDGRLDPDREKPTFDLDMQLSKLDLTQLNDYLRAYAKLDVERGLLSFDTEMAAVDGRLQGYLKPFLTDVKVLDWSTDEEEGVASAIWQGIVDGVRELFEDQSRDRVATRIPIEGSVGGPDVDVLVTIGKLLQNAFLDALRRGIENSVRQETIPTHHSEPEHSKPKEKHE